MCDSLTASHMCDSSYLSENLRAWLASRILRVEPSTITYYIIDFGPSSSVGPEPSLWLPSLLSRPWSGALFMCKSEQLNYNCINSNQYSYSSVVQTFCKYARLDAESTGVAAQLQEFNLCCHSWLQLHILFFKFTQILEISIRITILGMCSFNIKDGVD